MKTQLVVGIVALLVLGGIANSCGSASKSGSDNSSAAPASQTSTDPFGDALDANPAKSRAMCAAYDTLVNQGWTDDNIYKQLDDAGAFDGYYGTGPEFFKRAVRWCYANGA